jgi:predicted secreted protein
MKGFDGAQDCTWEAGVAWLEEKYPDAYFNYGYSSVTGNSWIKIDGDLALKEERYSKYGAKLCNEFASQWEKEND